MSVSSQQPLMARGIVRSYLWVIIAVTLLTAVAAGATMIARPKLYVANAQVVVYSDSSKGAGTVPPDMGTEREVANSGIVAIVAAKAMNSPVDDATKGLSVSVPVDANVLQFKYSAATRSEALAGAVAFTSSYIDYRNRARTSKLAEVISPATVPTEPNQPNLPLVIGLGLVLGAMLGVGFAFVWDRVRGRFRDAADVARQTCLPVLAEIPAARQTVPLEPANGPSTPSREVYGYLAAQLTTWLTRGSGASLLVTSPTPGAGKTTVAARVAIAMAATGKEVVLIGGDLRHPDLHQFFGLPLTPGLTDVLSDSTKLDRAIHPTEFVNLRVLPGGMPRTGAWLNVEDLQLLLQGLSKTAFVVVDAPTAVGSAESAVLAGRTDFTLLVVDSQRGTRASAAAAVTALSGVGANLVGCVTNKPRPPHLRRGVPKVRPIQPAVPDQADREPAEPVTKSEHVGH
jgi:Mrp family chromosome partitioning ATPase